MSAKSEIAQAIGYSLVRWTALTRYVDDGRIEIDNSAAERALRGVALGRNNYLFMGSDAGGERAAAMYSLVETAKLNGLDPQAYLREVFDAHRRASDQPHRGIAAVEHRGQARAAQAGGLSMQGADPKLIDALSRASSLELFQLSTIIERMLADPRRIIAVRANMHLGQTVRFLDYRDGQMRSGKVVALKDTAGRRCTKRVRGASGSCRMRPSSRRHLPRRSHQPQPATPAPPRPARNDFRCGEKVAFEDKYLQHRCGHHRAHQPAHRHHRPGDGTSWRVGFGLLRHVLDI